MLVDVNDRVRVLVELEHTASTIRGQIAVEGAPAIDFFGWLELIDRLERASADRRTGVSAGDTCARPPPRELRADGAARDG